jgi:hypothetical protein
VPECEAEQAKQRSKSREHRPQKILDKAPRAIAAALGTEGFTLSHFEVQKIIDGATDEGDP